MHSHTTMRSLLSISTIFVPFLTSTTSASSPIIPQQQQQQQQQHHQTPFHSSSSKETPPSPPLPLLIWHGLGDQYDAPGLHTVGDLAQEIHPDTYVHYIRLAPSGSEDRRATFFGNLTEQLDVVCTSLREDERIWNHHQKGSSSTSVLVDALGFSQGGQFLRGLIETCEGLRVRSLVTVGAQHNGIAAIGRTCGTWDFLCKGAVAVMRGNAYTEYVQGNVVPAQYYRTLNDTKEGGGGDKEEEEEPEPVDEYLEFSNFLARVNAERKEEREEKKNSVYKARLTRLQKFVMVVFEDDTTVIPKESGWFAEVNRTSGKVTPLRERKIYREDWIGLKVLDEKSALVFESMEGDHMQLDDEVLSSLFEKYFGPEKVFAPSHDDDDDNEDDEDDAGRVKQQQQQRTVRPRPRPCSGKKKLWNSKMEAWRRSWDAPIKEYL